MASVTHQWSRRRHALLPHRWYAKKPMPIYCDVMSDVKQESLANAKVRISTQQQCTYEGP